MLRVDDVLPNSEKPSRKRGEESYSAAKGITFGCVRLSVAHSLVWKAE